MAYGGAYSVGGDEAGAVEDAGVFAGGGEGDAGPGGQFAGGAGSGRDGPEYGGARTTEEIGQCAFGIGALLRARCRQAPNTAGSSSVCSMCMPSSTSHNGSGSRPIVVRARSAHPKWIRKPILILPRGNGHASEHTPSVTTLTYLQYPP